MINLNNHKITIFITAFVFIYFSIILYSGYFSDDAYSSQVKGTLAYESKNLLGYTIKTILGWIIGSGRLLILNQFQYFIFYFIENLFFYKFLIILLLIINFLLFNKLNYEITNSKNYSLYITIFSILSIQLREYHDPILGFHGFLIVLSILFFLQLLLLIEYTKNHNKTLFYISLIIFGICHLMYELAFIFLFLNLIFLQIREANFKKNIRILKFYFFVFVFAIFIFSLLQIRVHFFSINQAPDYKIFTNFFDIFFYAKILLIQILSALPGIYFFSIFEEIIFDKFLIFSVSIIFSSFLIFMFISKKTGIFINIKNGKTSVINRRSFLLYSILLSSIPASIILISSHNEYLLTKGIGYGYIFNFFSCYGFGYIIYFILISLNKLNKFFIIGPIIILFFLNSLSNINTVLKSNIIYKYPDKIFLDASRKGLFNELNDKSILIRHMKYPSDFKWNFYSKLNIKLNIIDFVNPTEKNFLDLVENGKINKLNNNQFEIKFLNNKIWISHYFYDIKGRHNGQYILAEVDKLIYEKPTNKIIKAETKNLKIFQQYKNKIYRVNLDKNIDFVKLIFQESQNPIKYFLHFDLYQY